MSPFLNPKKKKPLPPVKGGKIKKGGHAPKACMAILAIAALALVGVAQAQERPPLLIQAAGVVGFESDGFGFRNPGGGVQLGTNVGVDGGFSIQTLGTRMRVGESSKLQKVSTMIQESFWVTKGTWIYLLLGADHNMGGVNGGPSSDLAVGFGATGRVKSFTSDYWTRPPSIEVFSQLKFVDASDSSSALPNATGNYTELTIGVSFAPGQKK